MTEARASVLVVDDDRMNRMMLVRSLEQDGYSAASAESGERALEMLEAGAYDLVLLDVLMPGMDGFEVLEHLKGDETLRHIPVIMVSALDDVQGIARGIRKGAEDYLPKPFDPLVLRARVDSSLARKRLHDLELEHREATRQHAAQLEKLNAELRCRVEEQVGQLQRLGRLRRFLSPQLAELVVSAGEDSMLDAHRRQISVLFCDLRGFTAFSETSAPEQVMAVLATFHETFGSLVRRFDATVGAFAGDGVMIFFNDPIPCADPAVRAVQLAVALRDDMEPVLAEWQRQDCHLDFGVGISLGYATLGQVGFEGRYDYSAIGPVVNLASRLCDQARAGGDVLVDQAAYATVEHLVEAEPLGQLELKGFSRPRSVHRIIRIRPEEGRP